MGALVQSLYPTFLSDLGFSLGEVAAVIAPAILIGSVLGASVTSWYLGRFGYKATVLTAAFAVVLAMLPIMWMGSLEEPTFVVAVLIASCSSGHP